MMGADMSGGKAFTSNAAAGRIMKGIERRRSYVYFPARLGLSVRLSRFMPPTALWDDCSVVFRFPGEGAQLAASLHWVDEILGEGGTQVPFRSQTEVTQGLVPTQC